MEAVGHLLVLCLALLAGSYGFWLWVGGPLARPEIFALYTRVNMAIKAAAPLWKLLFQGYLYLLAVKALWLYIRKNSPKEAEKAAQPDETAPQ